MPFKSKAQRRKFAELLVAGKISPEVYEEWNRETGRAELPERVTPKRGARTTSKPKRKSTSPATGKRRAKPARRKSKARAKA